MFQRVCALDLEGVVAKYAIAPYIADSEKTTWYKILNPEYSENEERQERSSKIGTANPYLAGIPAGLC